MELRRLVRLQRAYNRANRGDELMSEQKVDEALKEYAAAASIAPEIVELPFWQAVTLASIGREAEAKPQSSQRCSRRSPPGPTSCRASPPPDCCQTTRRSSEDCGAAGDRRWSGSGAFRFQVGSWVRCSVGSACGVAERWPSGLAPEPGIAGLASGPPIPRVPFAMPKAKVAILRTSPGDRVP